MPYRQKHSRFWYASYIDARGKRVRRSTGTADYREAAALEGKWRAEVHRQAKWGESPRYTFDELIVAYLKATPNKKSTERDAYSIKALRPFFSGRIIADLAAEDIAAYKERRMQEVAVATLIKELSLLSSAISHANAEWDWRLPNVVQGRIPAPPAGRIRWITQEKAERLIQAAEKRKRAPYLADMIRLALNTGLRHRELLRLTWDRVDMGNRLIYLEAEDQKGGKAGSVPLNEGALRALRSRWGVHEAFVFSYQGEPLGSAKKSFRTACEAAGIANFTIHDLRHTFASWLVQAGVPIATVREVMRHRSIQTTLRYAHLAPENTRQAVAALDYDQTMTDQGANQTQVVDL